MEYYSHIKCAFFGPEERVECLIDSVKYTDSTLQDVIVLIRVNTKSMKEDFETVSSSLIEVNPRL